jgi:predicted nucleic acid-binding protein
LAVYTIDTSGVSCMMRREPGYEVVRDLVRGATSSGDRIVVPFMVLMEVEYTSLREEPRRVVDEWLEDIEDWPATIVESNREWRRRAAQIKSTYRLSLADAWVAALALMEDAELVHKDPEFDAVNGLKHLRLPYTPRSRR